MPASRGGDDLGPEDLCKRLLVGADQLAHGAFDQAAEPDLADPP